MASVNPLLDNANIDLDELKKKEEEQKKRDEEKEFRDLTLLQDKVKRQPELYIKETSKAVEIFKQEFEKVKQNPAIKNVRFIQYCTFLGHVNYLFPKDLEFLQNYIIDLFSSYGQILNPHVRYKVMQAFILMRNKKVIAAFKCISIMLKLLSVKDKELRVLITTHIIQDIKRMNQKALKGSVNKQIQNYIYGIISKNSDNIAKRAMVIMIELYRKNIWNDAKTVNVISSGCFNENPKIVHLVCKFLIDTTEGNLVEDDSDDEENGEENKNSKDLKISKKTKAKIARKEREMKKLKRRERRKSKVLSIDRFFPIDVIYNPQDFCDKLFSQIKKKSFKFEVNLAMMCVLSRMIGRNKLLVLNYYPFLQKYLNPHQKEIGMVLACLAEACHDLVPPEDLQPILKHIVDNFASERCHEEKINMGINAIREMCVKSPLMMDADTLNYLATFKDYKNRNVKQAARALINLFRDINPDLLEKQHQGRFDMLDRKELRKVYRYAEEKVFDRVYGAELLGDEGEGVPIEADRILDDSDFKKIKQLRKRRLEEHLQSVRERNKYNKEKGNGEYEEVDERDFRGEEGPDGEEIDDDDEEDDEDDDGEEIEWEEDDGEEDEEGEEDGEEGDYLEIEDDDEKGEEEEGEEGKEKEEGKEGENGMSEITTVKKEKKKIPKNARRSEGGGNTSKNNISQMDLELDDDDDDDESSEEENPHGFVSLNNINTYRKSRSERKEELREKLNLEGKPVKEKFYQGPKKKEKGSKTNEEKLKNKPLMMLRPKKNRSKFTTTKHNIKKMKLQLGHMDKKRSSSVAMKLKKRKRH
eukprot:CAMPEP_0176438470 /NCGR_PEP_ID=MMETSP0127-20121128/19305_1 /TAXON_ID=938130 /ORGANISM="Platyophrya macrostoma, Strain WH" /LENGTH=811 /DNA_ID=CAMNT_0017822431 /DNA_START=20 /DNA_END=2455 /DNA_ORIENTATION=+